MGGLVRPATEDQAAVSTTKWPLTAKTSVIPSVTKEGERKN